MRNFSQNAERFSYWQFHVRCTKILVQNFWNTWCSNNGVLPCNVLLTIFNGHAAGRIRSHSVIRVWLVVLINFQLCVAKLLIKFPKTKCSLCLCDGRKHFLEWYKCKRAAPPFAKYNIFLQCNFQLWWKIHTFVEF